MKAMLIRLLFLLVGLLAFLVYEIWHERSMTEKHELGHPPPRKEAQP